MLKNNLKLAKTHDSCKNLNPRLTVILIHGIASDSSTFNKFLERSEKLKSFMEVRFVTFDLLGSGKSLKSDELNYDYKDQLTALNNSIDELNVTTPLILVGHSLGTFIATRYAKTHPKKVQRLVLISPPIYTIEDLNNPAFIVAIKAFKDIIGAKDSRILQTKSFNNSMEKIVLDRKNYQTLAEVKTPTELIYGAKDQLIASHNIPKLLKENSIFIKATKTPGRHGVTQDKFNKIHAILKEVLNAETI